jgi:hypothetical protein
VVNGLSSLGSQYTQNNLQAGTDITVGGTALTAILIADPPTTAVGAFLAGYGLVQSSVQLTQGTAGLTMNLSGNTSGATSALSLPNSVPGAIAQMSGNTTFTAVMNGVDLIVPHFFDIVFCSRLRP